MQHKFTIRNVYYVPEAPHRILCPQQWAQQANGHSPKPEGTGCMTTSRQVVLFWSPDSTTSFECWVDADFAGNWYPPHAANDPMPAKSRSGWIITYVGCPITWASKIQTLTALSTTETEYIALSTALREVILLMELAKEVKKAQGIEEPPQIHCKVFEDQWSFGKYRRRTKHLNNYIHHFRSYLDQLTNVTTKTTDQLADPLTKPLDEATFLKFCKTIDIGRECENIGTIARLAVT